MTTLSTRAAELIEAGRYVAPARGYVLLTPDIDPRKTPYTAEEAGRGPDLNIYLGLQRSGRYLYMVDLDNHKAGQDPHAARLAFERAYPQIAGRLDWKRSKSGGWHAFFETNTKLDTGKIYDPDGHHIGELIGDRTLDPGELTPPWLSKTETEQLCGFWIVRGAASGGAQWSERAKEGKRLTAGYTRLHVARAELRTFLQTHCGKVGRDLDRLFSTHEPFNRSDAASHLMQNLMLFARKLPGYTGDVYATYRMVMAYWMAADSFGKASDKDYDQEKDGCSLIAQIIHGDPFGDGRKWTCPSWVPGQIRAPEKAPEPKPEPKPAHRPTGDQARHIARLRRVLESIIPDDFGRRVYTLVYLAERCGVKPRTIQVYLKALRDAGEIVTAQIGGNGKPYAVPTSCFGGADKSSKPDKAAVSRAHFGGADETPAERIQTPETDESQPQCKVDHLDTRVPPPAAPPAPGRAQSAGDPPAPAGAPRSIREAIARELAALAAEYLSTAPSVVGKICVSKKTRIVNIDGQPELFQVVTYRRTAPHFADLVAEHYGREDAIAAYGAEKARLAALEAQEREAYFKRLKTMTNDELIDHIAVGLRVELSERMRERATTFDKHLFAKRRKWALKRLEWRGLKMPAKPTKAKPVPSRIKGAPALQFTGPVLDYWQGEAECGSPASMARLQAICAERGCDFVATLASLRDWPTQAPAPVASTQAPLFAGP